MSLRRASADFSDGGIEQTPRWTKGRDLRRLVGFIFLHFLMLLAELFAVAFLEWTGNHVLMSLLMIPLTISGALCTYAAWFSSAPLLRCRFLPLGTLPLPLALLLAIPLGLFQGVIVILEVEDYFARTRSDLSVARRSCTHDQDQHLTQPRLDKFHCKAVNGVFEGLLTTAVVLYGYLGLGFPERDPNIIARPEQDPQWCRDVLATIVGVAFLSSGLCLMELDFAVSPRIQKRMRERWMYEILHSLYRICEVSSRMTLLVGFMVLTRRRLMWWFLPTFLDVLVSYVLVDLFGGCEVTTVVNIICALPCSFANVYRFVDSPNKVRAARTISMAFVCKNTLEVLLLPMLVWYDRGVLHDMVALFESAPCTVGSILFTIPVYWCLHLLLVVRSARYQLETDIFTACEKRDLYMVLKLARDATAVLDLNVYDIDGNTPLMLAVRAARGKKCPKEVEIVKVLVDQGSLVHLPLLEDSRFLRRFGRSRWTALHFAVHQGCLPVVKALVMGYETTRCSLSYTNGHFIDGYGNTPLHVAAARGAADIAHCLRRAWPHWSETKNYSGQMPLHLARSNAMRELLSADSTSIEAGASSPLLTPSSPVGLFSSQWESTRIPICHSFARPGSALRAPGLSSFVASQGGGTLGRAFLKTIDEIQTLSFETLSFESDIFLDDESRQHTTTTSSGESRKTRPSGFVRNSTPRGKPPEFVLEDLEPIDVNGVPIQSWRQFVDASQQSGQPLGAKAFMYIQEAKLGQGAFGTVWRGHNRQTNERFAVKNISISGSDESMTSDRECEIYDHIRMQPHPCLVKLIQAHVVPDCSFYMLIMELCAQGDLKYIIRQARDIDADGVCVSYNVPNYARSWACQVFLALEHVHIKMCVLLRDLKPDNVVISVDNIAKLTDFGYGRFGAECDGTWSFGGPPGSPGYIAPEVLLRQNYDCRADLYSYGVLLFVLFTGGVLYSKEPRPPLGKKCPRGQIATHEHDWKLLRECLEDPENNGAFPMPADAFQVVWDVTHQRMAKRHLHDALRDHKLLINMNPPPVDASHTEVEFWLAQLTPAEASTEIMTIEAV